MPEVARASVQGIVFDAVGTLIEPDPPVAVAYRAAALTQGVAIDLAEVKSRFRRAFLQEEREDAAGLLETDEPRELLRWRRIVGQVLHEVPDPDRAFHDLWEHFGQSLAWRWFDDVLPSVSALAALGLPIAVASNFDGRLRRVIGGLGTIPSLVDALVVSSEVGYRKPHPAFFAAVSRRLGLAPERILYVGDDVENDLLGSERAGFRAVLIDRKGNCTEGIAHVPDLHAVVAKVRSMNGNG